MNIKRVVLENWTNDIFLETGEAFRGLKELEILNPSDILTISNLFPLLSCESLTTLVIHKTPRRNSAKNDSQINDTMSVLRSPEDAALFPNLTTLKFIDENNERKYSNYTENTTDNREIDILGFLLKTLAATKPLINLDITMINSNWGLPLTILFLTNPAAEINVRNESYSAIPILGLGMEKLSQLERFILRAHSEDVAISMYFYSNKKQMQLITSSNIGKQDKSHRQLRKFIKSGYIKETKSPRFNFITNLTMSDLWMDILETQFNLEEMDYEFILGEPDQNLDRFVEILQRNRKTLRRLKLFNRSRRFTQSNLWSGRDFSGLERLECLSLVNLCKTPRPDSSPTKQQQLIDVIKDLEYLPSTLKYLELHCPFDAREQDISSMLKSLSNLETLKLISNESDKPWWFHGDEPKWILDVKELEILIRSLRTIKVIDILWRPPTVYGAARISYAFHEDKTIEIGEKKVSFQYFPVNRLKLLQTEREFRRARISVVP